VEIEKILTLSFSKAFKRDLKVTLSQRRRRATATPVFVLRDKLAQSSKRLIGGDPLLCYELLRKLKLTDLVSLAFIPEVELRDCDLFFINDGCSCYEIFISNILVCKLFSLRDRLDLGFKLQVPAYVPIFVSRGRLLLQVNDKFFETILYRGGLKMAKETEVLKLDLCLGTLELTPEEYNQLRVGQSVKLINSGELKCTLLAAGIQVGEAKISFEDESCQLEVTSLKFSRFNTQEVEEI